jgi:hypothetical protein
MKRQLFGLLCLLVALSSCNWNTEPQYSPEIYTSYFYVNPIFVGDSLVGAKDTLYPFPKLQDDSYEVDTMYVGDTVLFASTYYTLNSNLIAVKMDWDTLRMNLWYSLTEDIEKVLTSESNIEKGRLYFYSGYNRVSFPVRFSPIEKGGMNLKLTVESDSEFSTASALIYIPVKEPIVDSVAVN